MSNPILPTSAPLFDDFPLVTDEEWYAAAVESLGGASFEKTLTTQTYEGLTLMPLYRRGSAAQIKHQHTLPGFPPYVRGAQAAGYLRQPWRIAQELPYPAPEAFNTALRADLERGQDAINLALDTPSRSGLDPDQDDAVGHGGLSLAHLDDFATAFAGVNLIQIPVTILAGTSALPLTALLVAFLRQQGQSSADFQGCVANDPLSELAQNGALPASLDTIYTETALLTAWAVEQAPRLDTLAISTLPYHNAGANAVQELAFAIATGVEYLRHILTKSLRIDDAAPRTCFVFAVGEHFFMEVAKLRAARILWSQVVRVFGGSADSQVMKLHTRTGTLNKTAYDPYVNMLRTTLEAFAGAIGGTSSMHVAPYDESAGLPDEFSRRIARNQQLILQHECNLSRVIDPAGGSWYVETLTDWLARQAWALFQEIEKRGGMFAALQAGFPQEQIAQVASQRMAHFERRKDVLVGVNLHPNLTEEPPRPVAFDYAAVRRSRAQQIGAYRENHRQAASALSRLAAGSTGANMALMIEAAQAGATLNQLTTARRIHQNEAPPTVTPILPFRLAEPYEQLRQNAEAFRQRTGTAQRIFLANVGQYRARAEFTTDFFQVGGFEILNQGGFANPEDAAKAALESGAPVIAICSTDDAYPSIVPSLVSQIKSQKPEAILILAGYPQDQLEAHRSAGIDEFIHLRANCYVVNRWLQDEIGRRA